MEGIMMWCYVQLPDETQFAYSETRDDGTVEIAIERPRDWGFDTARCFMPAYRWFEVDGFSQDELDDFESFLRDNAPLIFELADRRLEEKTAA